MGIGRTDPCGEGARWHVICSSVCGCHSVHALQACNLVNHLISVLQARSTGRCGLLSMSSAHLGGSGQVASMMSHVMYCRAMHHLHSSVTMSSILMPVDATTKHRSNK